MLQHRVLSSNISLWKRALKWCSRKVPAETLCVLSLFWAIKDLYSRSWILESALLTSDSWITNRETAPRSLTACPTRPARSRYLNSDDASFCEREEGFRPAPKWNWSRAKVWLPSGKRIHQLEDKWLTFKENRSGGHNGPLAKYRKLCAYLTETDHSRQGRVRPSRKRRMKWENRGWL